MRKMARLTFFLSGEHPKIPFSEVISALEAEGFVYEKVEELDQLLIVRTDADLYRISSRLGMCHWIGEHFCSCPPEDVVDSIGRSDLVDFLPHSKSLSVRARRIKQYSPEIDTQVLAKRVADKILEAYDYDVDLEDPGSEVMLLLVEGKSVVSLIRAKVDRSSLEERRPQKRVAVHPSTMQPNLARALVNLARTPRRGRFLDPFCGIGGILLEAGLIGADPIGVDINRELVEGAEQNLREAGIGGYELMTGDARDLDIDQVDAIATDPPYGRQASTGGLDLKSLYESSLPNLADLLKEDGYLCISAPEILDLENMTKQIPLEVVESYRQRVHKSLVRNIYVFRRSWS